MFDRKTIFAVGCAAVGVFVALALSSEAMRTVVPWLLSKVMLGGVIGYAAGRLIAPALRLGDALQRVALMQDSSSVQVAWMAVVVRVVLIAAFALAMGLANATGNIPDVAYKYKIEHTQSARLIYGLNAPVAMLAAQVEQESGWRSEAVSPVGARGLTQFMPATARWWVTQDPGLYALAMYSPRWSLRAQVGYMHYLTQQLPAGLPPKAAHAYALASYNGGLGHTLARLKASPDRTNWLGTTHVRLQRVSPPNQIENQEYAPRIFARMDKYIKAGWQRGSA
jgi:soluble lytic murein transglycosylase-like protein